MPLRQKKIVVRRPPLRQFPPLSAPPCGGHCFAVRRPPLRRFPPLSAHRRDTVKPRAPTTRTALHRALSPPNHAAGRHEQEAVQYCMEVCMEVPSDDPSNNNGHNNNEQEAAQVCIINV
ncbi:hypothetical protein GUJ93_ZPchr0013g35139 [Zizania palustris]|uniref:Uncharacterized protein n=1 Tax=Zizania palustris TaxID=103762 RepID=A0A8J5X050_ZIZPA|nr:hypothetical protein GUJ93_ZPchr0013g35139 [Zizania palustris]